MLCLPLLQGQAEGAFPGIKLHDEATKPGKAAKAEKGAEGAFPGIRHHDATDAKKAGKPGKQAV